MSDTSHVLIKFHYHAWEKNNPDLLTIDQHEEVIKKYGKCWFGRMSPISRERAEALRGQIETGVDTYAFLYCIKVPKDVQEDRVLWYRAPLLGISIGDPKDRQLIPESYRDKQLGCAFLLGGIEPIEYPAGETPKVPGQAAVRYVILTGPPTPENLYLTSDPNQRIASLSKFEPTEGPTPLKSKEAHEDQTDLQNRVIDLQEEVINLQNEIADLKSYKDFYDRIISTDYLFSSESFLETWLADNIHKILPEFEIIDRQPKLNWPDGKFGRLDLLAKNKETDDIGIIEVKTRKRSQKSGYDQYVRYTTWARQNLDPLKEKYKASNIKPTENLDFIIITDFVTDEMKAICKDHGIRLVHIIGGLSFERVI